MSVSFKIKTDFPVSSKQVYNHWLNGDKHAQMTGGDAKCDDIEGSEFEAWNGYITGRNLTLEPFSRIVQRWRTTEFDDDDHDSVVEIELNDTNNGCEFTLTHSQIPEGQPDYKQGWQEHYFEPMLKYFALL